MPRKTKLTPAVQEALTQALTLGATHEHACAYAGISPACFYNWMQRGEQGRPPYVEFLDAVKRAESRAVVTWLAQIEAAARNGQWQAAAWKLERRYPKVWGRQAIDQATPEFVLTVHYADVRERLSTRLEHLGRRHEEDAEEGIAEA